MTNQRYRNTYIDGCSHFCTVSVVERLPVLDDDMSKRLVLNSWNRYRKRFGVLIEGYVLMPEHFHILIRGSADGVQKFMQYSLAQSSREIRNLLERMAGKGDMAAARHLDVVLSRANGSASGKVWKERFRCIALDQEDAVLVKLDYIHNNPVKRGLVESPEDWVWSSSSHYLGLEGVLSVVIITCGNL